MSESFEQPLYWLLSTVPQALAAGFAILVAVLMPHILAFSSLILSRMAELHTYWSSRVIDSGQKHELGVYFNDGNAPEFLALAEEIARAYGKPEHDRGPALDAEAKLKAAQAMFRRRRERLHDTGRALAVVGFTVVWSLVLLAFVPRLSAPERAIPVIVGTLLLALASVGSIYRLARTTFTEF